MPRSVLMRLVASDGTTVELPIEWHTGPEPQVVDFADHLYQRSHGWTFVEVVGWRLKPTAPAGHA